MRQGLNKTLLLTGLLGLGGLIGWWFTTSRDNVITHYPAPNPVNSSTTTLSTEKSSGVAPTRVASLVSDKPAESASQPSVPSVNSTRPATMPSPPTSSDNGQQMVTMSTPEPSPMPFDTEVGLEQQQLQAQLALENSVNQLNAILQQNAVDEAKSNQLQQKVDKALTQANIAAEVAVKTSQCTSTLCKLELKGQPTDKQDVVMVLQQQQVFVEGTEVLALPEEHEQGWTFYIGTEGQALSTPPTTSRD